MRLQLVKGKDERLKYIVIVEKVSMQLGLNKIKSYEMRSLNKVEEAWIA